MLKQALPIAADRRAILREHFITATDRPTYEQLSEEFGVGASSIKNWAADESWVALRIAHQEKQCQQSDALGVVLKASVIDRRAIESCSDAVLRGFQAISRIYDQINFDRAATTNSTVVNTLTFATKNLSEACWRVGIIGLPKGLADAGKSDNGRWNPELLQQINITVAAAAERAKTTVNVPSAKASKVEPAPATPATPGVTEPTAEPQPADDAFEAETS